MMAPVQCPSFATAVRRGYSDPATSTTAGLLFMYIRKGGWLPAENQLPDDRRSEAASPAWQSEARPLRLRLGVPLLFVLLGHQIQGKLHLHGLAAGLDGQGAFALDVAQDEV